MSVRKEGRCVENCAVTSEGRGQVHLVLQTNIFRGLCSSVDREREVGMQSFGDFGLKDQRDVRIGRVDVVGIFVDRFIDRIGARLVDDQDIARWLRPL